jgi:hypothetical protein
MSGQALAGELHKSQNTGRILAIMEFEVDLRRAESALNAREAIPKARSIFMHGEKEIEMPQF